jgi:hypothetical protein
MADFNGNKVFGRLMTDQACYAPPKMLTRKPGRCSEPLEQAKKSYEAKGMLDRFMTPKDGWGTPSDQNSAILFKRECERWPDQIPESFLEEQRQRLIDHQTGKNPLPPEESLRLRRDVSTLEDIYRPGPRFEAGLSAQEQAWLDARNLRNTNSLEIALLGPIFGGPGAATRMLGGSEQQVAAANQAGAIVFDLATSGVGAGRMGGGGAGRPMRNPATEYVRGAPLEPVARAAGTAQGAGVKPAAGAGAIAKPPSPPAGAGPGGGLVVAGLKAAKTRTAAEVNAEHVAKGNDPPYKDGTKVIEREAKVGEKYDMVIDAKQKEKIEQGEMYLGGWATTDSIPNQSAARDALAIKAEYKPELPYIEVKQPGLMIREGIAGPQGSLNGGANQIELIVAPKDRGNFFNVVDIKPLSKP